MELLQSLVFDEKGLARQMHLGSAALLPTDTLPALASCPSYAAQLWQMKNRSTEKPLILMGSSAEELLQLVDSSALEDASLMAESYWPGALTMVLPSSGEIVEALNPSSLMLGMRVPACDLTRDFLAISGPLATTSANLSGISPSLTAQEAANCFPEVPLLGPLPWPVASGLASTVVAWNGSGDWSLLREGAIFPSSHK